ncbi:MAG: HAD family hydrolase [Lentisphaerae bacterium]|nr:HAD family hydrolase [Lentisphaerota bacterium]
MKTIRCVFFDRDGIVNEQPMQTRYVLDWQAFRLIPEFVECVRIARRRGYAGAIVTNQRGVAVGAMSRAALEDIHRRLRERLAGQGAPLLDIAYCPHDENSCDCRKPAPGMILELAKRHGIDLKASWMIGDSERDIEAGRRAGCRTVLVGAPEQTAAEFVVPRMDGLPRFLEERLPED